MGRQHHHIKGEAPVFCSVQEQSPDLCGGSSPVTPVPTQDNAPQECAELAQPGRASRVQAEGQWGRSSRRCLRETKKLALSIRRRQSLLPPPPPPPACPGTICLSEGKSDHFLFLFLLQLSFLASQTLQYKPTATVTLVPTCLSPHAMFQSTPWWNLFRRPPEHGLS